MITHQHIAQIAHLRQFDVIRFTPKACSHTHLLRLRHKQVVLVDAVSSGEIERALAVVFGGRRSSW